MSGKDITFQYREELRKYLLVKKDYMETMQVEPDNKNKIERLEKEYKRISQTLKDFEQSFFA